MKNLKTSKTQILSILTIVLIFVFSNTLFAQTPKKYAVVVGCANYKLEGMDLNFSDDDAYRYFAYLLSCNGGGAVESENIVCLVDEAATKENILKTMNKIFSKASENDMLIFYFSGHGTEGAFCPTDVSNQYSSLLTYEEVRAVFKKHPAKHKVCLADACFSGKIFEGQPNTPTTSSSNVATNVVIMMSSKSTEKSQENPLIRQGAFSYYLLKGLRGAADRDQNKIVTLEELFPYIKANVSNFTKELQTPQIDGNAPKDMPMGILE